MGIAKNISVRDNLIKTEEIGENATVVTNFGILFKEAKVLECKNEMQAKTVVDKRINAFQCEKCFKSFGSKKHLSRHVRTVHEWTKGNQIQCQLCSKSFREKCTLRTHVKLCHEG